MFFKRAWVPEAQTLSTHACSGPAIMHDALAKPCIRAQSLRPPNPLKPPEKPHSRDADLSALLTMHTSKVWGTDPQDIVATQAFRGERRVMIGICAPKKFHVHPGCQPTCCKQSARILAVGVHVAMLCAALKYTRSRFGSSILLFLFLYARPTARYHASVVPVLRLRQMAQQERVLDELAVRRESALRLRILRVMFQ